MSSYRIAVNVEWTSVCNARCVMCPREAVGEARQMSDATWSQVLQRLGPDDVFRAVIAGYGEPTTHRHFAAFVASLRGHPVRFDMVSNGQRLDADRLRHLDGAIGTLIVSFSSIDPQVYERVHVNLDQTRVMDNIRLAQRLFRQTKLAISLTPLPECLPSLPDTVAWLRAEGVQRLTMSPTFYNRGGALDATRSSSKELRATIRRFGLRSQEFDFVPSAGEIWRQWRRNRVKCVPRNTDLLISAAGEYQYCYNDVRHAHAIGSVADLGIREALVRREGMDEIGALCGDCNMRGRYGPGEALRSVLGWALDAG